MTDDLPDSLANSDLGFVRVLDDVIAVLVDKNIMQPSDLPEAAWAKYLERRDMRAKL
jgi:hypothetical protein